MVECHVGCPAERKGFAAPVKKSIPDTRHLLTLILRHQTGI
jgi:hypothetical protein